MKDLLIITAMIYAGYCANPKLSNPNIDHWPNPNHCLEEAKKIIHLARREEEIRMGL